MAPWHFPSVTTLLLQLTVFLKIFSVMCELPIPVNVNVNSSNFIHLLTWDPGPGTPKGVYYNVTFTSERGGSWELVPGCEHVETLLVCNVTKAFSELHLVYYNQITAVMGDQVSGAAQQTGFKPIAKTSLEPPVLSVEACRGELCVSLKPPVSHLRDMYASFFYTLNIRSSNGQFSVNNVRLRGETLKNLTPGVEYCVSVRISSDLDRRESAYGQQQCAFTDAVYTAERETLIGLSLLVLIALIVIVLLERAGFIRLRTSLPLVLTSLQLQKEERILIPWDVLPCSPEHGVASCSAPRAKDRDKELEDHSDEETETESTGGEGYESHRAAKPLCSTSSSLSLFNVGALMHVFPKTHTVDMLSETSMAKTTQPNSPFLETDQLKEPVFTPNSPQSILLFPYGAEPTALDHRILWGQNLVLSSPTNTETRAFVPMEELEAEESSQEVNLLSVTLGGREKEEEEEGNKKSLGMDVVEEVVATSNHLLPSQFTYRQRQPESSQIETFVLEEEGDEEEVEDDNQEEEYSGYMSR